jgi:hypothetical protein
VPTVRRIVSVPAPVDALAFLDIGGRMLLATAGAPCVDDGEIFSARETLLARHAVRMWDVAAGTPAGPSLVGHTSWVTQVTAFTTGNGEARIVTGSVDGTVRVWDVATGIAVGPPIGGHDSTAPRLTAFADTAGRWLVVASGRDDDTIRVWDPETGQQAAPPMAGDSCGTFALTTLNVPDGRTLIVSGGGTGRIRLWDPATGQQVGRSLGQRLRGNRLAVVIGLAPAGRNLVAAIDDTGVKKSLRLWDVVAGRQAGRAMRGHPSMRAAIAALPAAPGPLLVTGGADGTVRIWDQARARQVHQINGVGAVSAVSAAASHPLVAIGSDTGLHVVDLRQNAPTGPDRSYDAGVNAPQP